MNTYPWRRSNEMGGLFWKFQLDDPVLLKVLIIVNFEWTFCLFYIINIFIKSAQSSDRYTILPSFSLIHTRQKKGFCFARAHTNDRSLYITLKSDKTQFYIESFTPQHKLTYSIQNILRNCEESKYRGLKTTPDVHTEIAPKRLIPFL